ncbi:MAG: outer membrane protein assembly factor BamA [Dissulfurispiraceae bacterium]
MSAGKSKLGRARIAFLAMLVTMSLLHGISYAQEQPIVTAIEVKGLRRIEEGAIRSRVSQKIREPLSQEKTTEDIKTLYKMGYFDDVRVEIEPFEGGIKVIYVVKEKPTIVRVEFQGNKEFEDSKLKEKINITPGAIADITLINDNATKLRAFYEDEGYYLASIVPVLRKLKEGELALTYQIEEGQKVKIKEIRIEGNKIMSTRKIKGVMKTTERGLFSFITGTGYYKKEEMKADVEKIRDLYYNNGYIKVTVGEPQIHLTDDMKGMKITIQISEGEQFRVSSVEVTGEKVYTEQEVRQQIKIAPKMVFSKAVLQRDVAAISELYANNGYALVSIFPDLTPDEEKKETRIVFKINEGDKYRIGRIEISGNTRTRDKVIRREIRLDEGDLFNAASLKRSYERLNNLQFFETVDISPKPEPEEKLVDVDVKVKEKSTGFLSVGGGYSSVDKIVGMVDVTQGNLWGTGQYLKLRGELGALSSYYEVAYKDPWFLDKQLSFGASIYRNTRDYGDFDREGYGTEFSLGKNFWEYWTATLSYNFEDALVYNVLDTASTVIKDQGGTYITSAFSFSLMRDSTDNHIDPMRGSRNDVSVTVAGFGGNTGYIKGIAESGWYFPIFDVTAIHLKGTIGYETAIFGKKLPLYEQFYVGGINTVRGFDFGYAGPLDINGQPIGGTREVIFNSEYIFPIIPEYKFKGVVFFDAGKGYDASEGLLTNLRYGAGPGIRWISPVGPIRVEWGFNLNRRPGEAASKIEFTFGSVF